MVKMYFDAINVPMLANRIWFLAVDRPLIDKTFLHHSLK